MQSCWLAEQLRCKCAVLVLVHYPSKFLLDIYRVWAGWQVKCFCRVCVSCCIPSLKSLSKTQRYSERKTAWSWWKWKKAPHWNSYACKRSQRHDKLALQTHAAFLSILFFLFHLLLGRWHKLRPSHCHSDRGGKTYFHPCCQTTYINDKNDTGL